MFRTFSIHNSLMSSRKSEIYDIPVSRKGHFVSIFGLLSTIFGQTELLGKNLHIIHLSSDAGFTL